MSPSSNSWLGLSRALVLLAAAKVNAGTKLPDLATVLAGHPSTTQYFNLIKQFPDFVLQIAEYGGVTMIVPNDAAFNTSSDRQTWDSTDKDQVLEMLSYHTLHGALSTQGMAEGPTIFKSSFLTNTTLTNVTDGALVRIDKQPGNDVVFTSGGGARSELVVDEIPFTDGTVQIVNTIMVAPTRFEVTAREYEEMNGFLGAVYDAGLLDLFANTSDVTIFAPDNFAFQRVAGAMGSLSKDQLAAILKYHIVVGQVLPAAQLGNGTALDSFGQTPLHITRSGNGLYVDAAQIVEPDVIIANGIVHVIGDVLNPSAAAMLPNPAVSEQAAAYPMTGATSTGVRVPTPFITALPCTASCPATSSVAVITATSNHSATGAATVKKAAGVSVMPSRLGMAAAGLGVVVLGFVSLL